MGDAPRKFFALRLNLRVFQGHSHSCYYSQSNAIANFCVGEFNLACAHICMLSRRFVKSNCGITE